MKKNLFFILTLVLGFGLFLNPAVFAEETPADGIMPLTEAPSTDTSTDSAGTVGGGINADDDINQDSDAVECLEENCPEAGDIEDNGLSGEPEVVCADKNEPGCEDSADDETESTDEQETPLWPMYVSLGALGVMILLVIIINLLSGRKRKK